MSFRSPSALGGCLPPAGSGFGAPADFPARTVWKKRSPWLAGNVADGRPSVPSSSGGAGRDAEDDTAARKASPEERNFGKTLAVIEDLGMGAGGIAEGVRAPAPRPPTDGRDGGWSSIADTGYRVVLDNPALPRLRLGFHAED